MRTYQKILVGAGVVGTLLGTAYSLGRHETKSALVPRASGYESGFISRPNAPDEIESPNMLVRITDAGSFDPHYRSIEIEQDGTVFYREGIFNPARPEKELKGTLSKKQVKKMMALLGRREFASLNGMKFDNPKIYDSNTITTEGCLGGRRYVVSEYADSGPQTLHGINSEIWDLAAESLGIRSELYSDINFRFAKKMNRAESNTQRI